MPSKVIRIIISEEPQAKGRARTANVNGRWITFSPERTSNAQDAILWRLMRHKDDCFPAHVPVKLTATFYRTRNKSILKRETLPVRKPDADNFLKLLLDAMNGVLVVDDAQITTMNIKKRWSLTGEGYITIKLEQDIL